MLQVHFVTKLFNYLIIIRFNCKEIKIGFFGFQGGITHQDSAGHKDTIGPCDVQIKTYFEYVGQICCVLRSFMRNKDEFFLV